MSILSVASADERLVHYEAIGRGKPVVFVHGWIGSWRYWWTSMQALSSQHRTFAFDFWGFGESSKVATSYTFDSYVEQLASFIDELGISKPATLVGHAMGAAVALRYAGSRPQKVERLVAVALPLTGEHINRRLYNPNAAAFIDRYLNKTENHSEVKFEAHKADGVAVNTLTNQLAHSDFVPDLQQLPCPALLIYGAEDTIVREPFNGSGRGRESSANRYWITLEGCQHFPMLEQPAVFNRLLKDFINNGPEEEVAPKSYWQRRTR